MVDPKVDVLFVCSNPSYRTYKTAKALSLTGKCNPHLLAANWNEELHSPVFKEAVLFGKGFWKLFGAYRILDFYLKGKGDLFMKPFLNRGLSKNLKKFSETQILHVVAPPPALTKAIMNLADKPIVFDQYDLFLQSYGDAHPWDREVEDEKHCMEHSDALVHKGPKDELDFYREKDYSLPGIELSYPDGCDENLFEPMGGNKLRDKDGQWHIAYVGGLHGSDKYYYLLPLFKRLAEQNIHSHVYPAEWSYGHELMKEYKEFAEVSPFFHFYEPMPYGKLIKELSRYDFGLYYFDFDPVKWPGPTRKLKTAAGNKIPTYYEAGIPVIIGEKLEYSAGFVSKYGAGFVIGDKDIDSIVDRLDGANMQDLLSNVGSAREDLSLKNQGLKLLELYRTVLEKK